MGKIICQEKVVPAGQRVGSKSGALPFEDIDLFWYENLMLIYVIKITYLFDPVYNIR